MTNQQRLEEDVSHQTRTRVYIKNDAGTWVDFTEKYSDGEATAQGLSIPTIHHMAEGKYGQPITKAVKISVNNSDRYWDKNPPTAFADGFHGKEVKIALIVAGGGGTETNLGHFRIKLENGIKTDLTDRATLMLEPLTDVLAGIDASTFANGQQKWRDKSWLFLASELIRSEFGDASGDLPSSYTIPDSPAFDFPDGAGHFSSYGKPPQLDDTGSHNLDNTDPALALDYDKTNDILYVGIAEDLWKLDRTTDTWENLGEDAGAGAGVTVRTVYDTANMVIVCKWDDVDTSPYSTTLYINVFRKDTDVWDTTARATTTTFFSGTWFIYDGAFDGGTNRQWRGRYSSIGGPGDNGLNIPMPFRQRVTDGQTTGPAIAIEGVSLLSQLTYTETTPTTPVDADRQFVGFKGASADTSGLGVRVAYGTKPNVAIYKDGVDGDDAHLYIAIEVSAGNFQVVRYILNVNTAPTNANIISANRTKQIHGLTIDSNKPTIVGNSLFLSWVEFDEQALSAATPDLTTVYTCNGRSLPNAVTYVADSTNTSDANDLIYDIHMFQVGVSGYTFCKMTMDMLHDWPTFHLVDWDFAGNQENGILLSSSSYLKTNNKSAHLGESQGGALVDTATGAIYRANAFSFISLVDGGRVPVPDSLYVADFAFGDVLGDQYQMFGLSMPFHDPQTQGAISDPIPTGKYYLWQYDDKHTGRIELGDFDSMNKLEAVSRLAQAFNHLAYVDPDGDWVIAPRDPTTTPTVEIKQDRWGHGWQTIKNKANLQVENFIQESPYAAYLQTMETSLVLRDSSLYNGTVSGVQNDQGERRVRLRVINGGLVSVGRVVLDWQPYNSKQEVPLGAVYTSGTSVTLESVVDVAVGDLIRMPGSAEKTIITVTVATKVITIDSGFADPYPIQAKALITKPDEAQWSSLGITTLDGAINSSVTALTVDNSTPIEVDNYIIIGQERMKVTAKDGLDLTVVRGTNPVAHSDAATIGTYIKLSGLGKWFLVGGQAITVSFDYEGDEERELREGDFVEFICKGMKLKKRESSIVRFADQTSIDKYTQRKAKVRINNRFMDDVLLNYYVNTIGGRRVTPKRQMDVVMGLDLQFSFFDTFYCKSDKLFPDETNERIAVIVREILFDAANHVTTYKVEEQ